MGLLEAESQSKLDRTRSIRLRGNRPKQIGRIRQVVVGRAKPYMVERVEELRRKLQVRTLGDAEAL